MASWSSGTHMHVCPDRCGEDDFIYSPSYRRWPRLGHPLDRYCPDGDLDACSDDSDSDSDHVSAFIELVTRGATALARVGFGLVNQATGEPVTVFREKDPVLFDAGSEESCTWGSGELARRSHLRPGSRFVLGDRLRIECAVDVCGDRLTFDAPPPASSSAASLFLRHAADGKVDELDVAIDVGGETFAAHASVLDARAPGLLKHHGHTARRSSSDNGKRLRKSIDDGGENMPAQSFKALLHFAYTDELPVVGGLDGAGHKAMLRHLLVAAERYGMGRLRAICERVLCKSVDVETVEATLAMAELHGFEKLTEACVEFMAAPGVRFLRYTKSISFTREL